MPSILALFPIVLETPAVVNSRMSLFLESWITKVPLGLQVMAVGAQKWAFFPVPFWLNMDAEAGSPASVVTTPFSSLRMVFPLKSVK